MPIKDPDKKRAYQREWCRRKRADGTLKQSTKERKIKIILEAKNVPCAVCKESFPPCCMDFHHRNPEEKKYEINLHKHLKRLDQLSRGAEEKGNWNAAVTAEKSRGQVGGLYIDRKEIMHGSIDQLNREEVDKLLK